MCGLIALLAFLGALASEMYLLMETPDRLWYEARAAAESTKTLAWRYMAGGAPLPLAAAAETIDRAFLERLHDILQDLHGLDLSPENTTQVQITPEMRRVRGLDLAQRKAFYQQSRIEEQWRWYTEKAATNHRTAHRWALATIALEFLGVLGATFKTFHLIEIDMLGILAAGAAALAAWAQSRQFRTLSHAYVVASQELASIRSRVCSLDNEEDWARFVQETEEAISREHALWRASRGLYSIHP